MSPQQDRPNDVARNNLSEVWLRPACTPDLDGQLLDDDPRLVEDPVNDGPVVNVTAVEADVVVVGAAACVEPVSQISVDVFAPAVTYGRRLKRGEGLLAHVSQMDLRSFMVGPDRQLDHVIGTPQKWWRKDHAPLQTVSSHH
jgi:hypothetical protein